MSRVDVQAFRAAFDGLAAIGRNPATGGYNRFAWTDEDRAARTWFADLAARRGADAVHVDANGNVWAFWGDPSADGLIVTGSHLDTVPEGGAYDGALGVVAGLLAAGAIRRTSRHRTIAVVAFADEEGARYGVACVGSKLLTGALDAGEVRHLADRDGTTITEAMAAFDVDTRELGPDPSRLARIAAFVELHIEQGRQLDRLGAPLAAASEIWPHGRWRTTFVGEANHAGTTRLEDRNDPMLPFGAFVAAARQAAARHGALATVGRVEVDPNGTNVIPSRVVTWLDARAPTDADLDALVAELTGEGLDLVQESRSPAVVFDTNLRAQLGVDVAIATGAGHDAGVLAAACPTAMLFVRNPDGVSHSAAEHATDDDCVAGVNALAEILDRLSAA